MSTPLSRDSQSTLLLTAPLMAGNIRPSADLLTPSEFRRLVVFLREREKSPGDFLTADAEDLVRQCGKVIDTDRLQRLLGRGFLLSQAVERWQARGIWVMTSSDPAYPQRFRDRLRDNAPALLYGCGDAAILQTGGLAVVGSRDTTPQLLKYAECIGQLVAHAGQTIVSGGARGIDQASMQGALQAEGKVVGMLADSLDRAALRREYRSSLMDGRLVIVSPYDPLAGFNVGNAMQRNKLVYALADAALVISSDYLKGGTWAGAVEALTKLRFVPVFVRSRGQLGRGITELQLLGARPWPNPTDPAGLSSTLADANYQNARVDGDIMRSSLVRESGSEQPITPATGPATARRHSKPRKPAEGASEPTLFDANPAAMVQWKQTTTPRKRCRGATNMEEGEANRGKHRSQ